MPVSDLPERTVIFTDGACKGNPGPGGWAWAIEGARWRSGYEPATTNQRMEITAAYSAVNDNPGPLLIVSDSTYVVNCFRDRWWQGWIKRGWKNSKKEPVANRDLWEPFIELVRSRDVDFEWVKGHSGHEMNDLVDRLAVAAVESKSGHSGDRPPGPDDIGSPDTLSARTTTAPSASPPSVARDRRAPEGHLWAVIGLRSTTLLDSPSGGELRRKMASIIAAQQELHGDVVVLSGARPGAEQIGALAAADASVPYVVILPYPDPVSSTAAEWKEFKEICDGAQSVVTLEAKQPSDAGAKSAALARRDGWLRSVCSGALVVTAEQVGAGASRKSNAVAAADDQLARFTKALDEDVWELPVSI